VRATLALSLWLCVDGCGEDRASTALDAGRSASAEAGPRCPPEEDLSGPDVSFTSEVMPLFSVSCAFSGCHDGLTRSAGLYLGPSVIEDAAAPSIPARVFASVTSPATTTPDMPRVTPGDPSHSFLWLKIEACQNRMGLACSDAPASPCGQRMPALSPELPAERRRLLGRWIVRGAPGPE